VPTLKEFWPRFLEGHARANRQKPSGIAAKEVIARVHVLPSLGDHQLDTIATENVQQLKAGLAGKAPKTVNNVLTVLNTMLKKAVEWGVIDRMPCVVRLLPVPPPSARFHDFEDFERLVEGAKKRDDVAYLVVLLGGEAGLRRGEITALEWGDVEFEEASALRATVCMEGPYRNAERGTVAVRAVDTTTGGGATRVATSSWPARVLRSTGEATERKDHRRPR
jgi:integrase